MMLRILPQRLAAGHRVDVVVSAYREDLSWLRTLEARGLLGDAATLRVYTKHSDTEVPGGIASIPLPNVGRCDHTYLHHIAENYDRLADTTLFLPGTARALWWKWLPLRFVVLPRLGAPGACISGAVRPFTAADRNLALDSYRAASGQGDTRVVPARVRPFHAWWAANFPGRPEPRRVAVGGVFVARRWAIRKLPLSLWRDLLDQHAAGDNVEVGHYMERSWYALLRS